MIFDENAYKNLEDIPKPFKNFTMQSKGKPNKILQEPVKESKTSLPSESASSFLPQGDLLFLLLLFFLMSDHDMDWLKQTVGI